MALQEPPSFRRSPNLSMSARSSYERTGASSFLPKRPNTVAVSVGKQLAWPGEFDAPPKSADSRGLRFAVDAANWSANMKHMPTEEEVLLSTFDGRPMTSR